MTDSNDSVAQEPTPAAVPLEPVQLTITDLQQLANIVDLAARRGAYQAAEMERIGAAFNKLAGFLAYVESTKVAEAPAEAPTEA